MADFLHQFIAHNRMLEGGFVIEDRLVTLADIDCPILSVVGTVDEIAPAAGVRAIRLAAPRADVYELALHGRPLRARRRIDLEHGHLADGRRLGRAGATARASVPEPITEVPDDADGRARAPGPQPVGYGLELAGAVGTGVARSMVGHGAPHGAGHPRAHPRGGRPAAAAGPARADPAEHPDLARAARRRAHRAALPTTSSSCSRTAPTAPARSNERIDNVVRGLISIGVRQGEHVGVLMGPRPSALALVVALSRLGAVAVLLRPDGDTAREAALGQVQRIIADPERAALAAGLGDAAHVRARRRRWSARPGRPADHRHGADRPRPGRAAQVVPRPTRAGPATSPSSCSPARARAPG